MGMTDEMFDSLYDKYEDKPFKLFIMKKFTVGKTKLPEIISTIVQLRIMRYFDYPGCRDRWIKEEGKEEERCEYYMPFNRDSYFADNTEDLVCIFKGAIKDEIDRHQKSVDRLKKTLQNL